ncbi:hypothetical protein [Ruegeria sp. R14_0]|uniref:hypothetical protein n=1 Tax=Ruegeria sp. R14_0 TaxID=2821100 RepID=UPI001ADC3331|nr:hypothetical protein [Ruegeria sp. R14_0]MBO9446462.1 hypothetical protein [Ruegeria sp. R14_0]
MKHLMLAFSIILAGVCTVRAESSGNPIEVLEWFDGCALLTQHNNGMTMDTNCIGIAVDYCTIGRVVEERLQCLVSLSEHVDAVSAEIKTTVPQSIGTSGSAARRYERQRLQLVEGVFDVCDASPSEEIPPDTWCEMYLSAGNWVNWRHLQRLADEVTK